MENTTENTSFCHDCGNETGVDADFCSHCGVRLNRSLESLSSLESQESSESLESPESESVAPAPLLPEEGWPKAGVEGVAGASDTDDPDDNEPTMLYTSAEFEKLTTDGIADENTQAEDPVEKETAEEPVVEEPVAEESPKEEAPEESLAEVAEEESPAEEPEAASVEDVVEEAEPAPPKTLAEDNDAAVAEETPVTSAAITGDIEDSIDDVPDDLPPAPEFLRTEPDGEPAAGVEKIGTDEEMVYTSQIETPEDTGGRKVSKQSQILTEGTLLNSRYEIVRKIGGGGMGAVYLASDRNLGGVLRAVKEMVQTHIEEDQQEKALADFKRESLLLTSLEHPCIPTIYDYFYDETACRFYLVMKYISGGDLAARLRSAPDGRIDEKSVTEWAAQTADVLDYLHSRRPPIVYRDLKPSNLMIDGNTGRIMLIDFGIARWVTKDEKGVTAVGTMGYAPPELFSGNVEPRSDIYSLGATMFHLLTGADPQSNPLLIFDFSKHPRPRQVNPAISNEMEQILMRTVEYNVELRYRSAGELREGLIAHLERVRYGQLSYGQPQAGPPVSAGAASGQNLVFCGFCGEKIIDNDVFCPYCGAKQAVADQVRKTQFGQVVQLKRVLARVTVLGTGELNPPTYDLEKESNVVGRRDPQTNIFPEVDLSKFDPQTKISRRHARIWKEGETFMIEDLGSSNGTVVVSSMNEAIKLPPHQPQILIHGSKLVLGDTTLHFVVG